MRSVGRAARPEKAERTWRRFLWWRRICRRGSWAHNSVEGSKSMRLSLASRKRRARGVCDGEEAVPGEYGEFEFVGEWKFVKALQRAIADIKDAFVVSKN